MSNLIPIQDNDGAQAVMGRDLHAFLEVTTPYRKWFPRMVEYGFVAGQDYADKNVRVQDSMGRDREAIDHIITLDMAKHLAMIQFVESTPELSGAFEPVVNSREELEARVEMVRNGGSL